MTGESADSETLLALQPQLWVLALATYGVGDVLTTAYGLGTGRAAEAGPIAGGLIHAYGLPGLVGLKIGTFALFLVVWDAVDTPGRVAIPLALAVAGALVTGWNLLVLF